MTQSRVPWQAKFIALALIWGSSFLFMKVGLAALHPIQIAAGRIFAAALILAILLRATGSHLPRERRVWGHLAVSSVFLTALPFTGFVVGETRVSSALAGIGNATTPIAAVLFALALLPSERLSGRKLAAVLDFPLVGTVSGQHTDRDVADQLGIQAILHLAGGQLVALHLACERRRVDADGHRDSRVIHVNRIERARVLGIHK